MSDIPLLDMTSSQLKKEILAPETSVTRTTPIATMTVEQFTELMVSIQETKAYLNAQREQHITNRIFADADGIVTGGMAPFRAKSEAEIDKFANDLKAYFKGGGKGCVVIAAAVLEDGTYRAG